MADITKGMTSAQNNRFILHDSKIEYGKMDNLDVVTKFIKERRDHQDIKEQIHAVWCVPTPRIDMSDLTGDLHNRLCFQIPNSDAGQRIETGMEKFLQQKNEILGNGGKQTLTFALTLICISSDDFCIHKIRYAYYCNRIRLLGKRGNLQFGRR